MTQEKGKGMTGYGGIVGFMSNGSGDDARSLIRYTRGAKLLVITVSFMQIYTRLPVKVMYHYLDSAFVHLLVPPQDQDINNIRAMFTSGHAGATASLHTVFIRLSWGKKFVYCTSCREVFFW